MRKAKYFGEYGGRYIPEVLRPAFEELEEAYAGAREDVSFMEEYRQELHSFVGRPTPLTFAPNLTERLGGAKIYLKLEGLAHTGAHKINNALGQALLARKMGKRRLIAETGAGQHGLASAAAAARVGLECEVFMGEVDMARQHPNVLGMRVFGAQVTPVTEGSRTLTDAVNAAFKNWTERVADTHYLLGSALGPSPYPEMVRDFQRVIGEEIREQLLEAEGRLPDVMVACVGGGSNAIGMFADFLEEKSVALVGVEAGGEGLESGCHAVRVAGEARTGIIQGYRSLFLQDSNGSLLDTHSISAGLDYAGIGPQLASLATEGRVQFTYATDNEVLEAVQMTASAEGILPALESSHALAEAFKLAPKMSPETVLVVNVSGRGDKDLFITAPHFDGEDWLAFLKSEVARLEGGEK